MYDVYFEEALEITIQNEGGYVDDPNDSGGETYKGIARNFHLSWLGWKIIDKQEDKKLLKHNQLLAIEVKNFYQAYWKDYKINEIGDKVAAILLFDAVVLMGRPAIKLFQESINIANEACMLEVDGYIGAMTTSLFDKYFSTEIFIASVLGYLQHGRTAKHHYKGWQKRWYKNYLLYLEN